MNSWAFWKDIHYSRCHPFPESPTCPAGLSAHLPPTPHDAKRPTIPGPIYRPAPFTLRCEPVEQSKGVSLTRSWFDKLMLRTALHERLSLQVPHKYGPISLAPLHFLFFPFMRKNKVVARKEGRGAQRASAGKEIQPEIPLDFRKVRRVDRAPGRASLQRTQPARGEKRACPPDPRNEVCLMVFARHALPSGPGKA